MIISKETFDKTPWDTNHFSLIGCFAVACKAGSGVDAGVKGLTKKNQNLRDHMTDMELLLTMIGEQVTTELSQQEKPTSFSKDCNVAHRGGKVTGDTRLRTERERGHSVVSSENFLEPDKNKVRRPRVPEKIDKTATDKKRLSPTPNS